MKQRHGWLKTAAALALAAAQPAFSAQPVITVENGLLTVQARNMPLHEILQKISTQAGVEIQVQGAAEQPVSADLDRAPLEDGLRRITQDFNSVFFYKMPPQERSSLLLLNKVLLYAKAADGGRDSALPPTVFRPGSGSAAEGTPQPSVPGQQAGRQEGGGADD